MSFAPFTRAGEYNELREHELRKRRLVLVDGNLMVNDSSHLNGVSDFGGSQLPWLKISGLKFS